MSKHGTFSTRALEKYNEMRHIRLAATIFSLIYSTPNLIMSRFLVFFSIFIISLSAFGESSTSRLMRSDELKQQAIYLDSNNLTFEEFFSAYRSTSLKERRYAEMYFLGVLDFTEGISWCSYKKFTSGTIAEWIEPLFEKADKKAREQRAARVIGAMLSKEFPCGERK